MRPRSLRSKIFMLGIGSAVLSAPHLALVAKAASAPRFHLEEATIADVHRAIRAKEITAEQLVQHYFIPLPDHFEWATASSPLSRHRSPGSDSIQTDLGSVSGAS